MDFNKALYLLESNFVKDALDKVITGDFKLTDKEKEKLLSLGLIGKNGKPTQKAKEEYSELFEALTTKDLINKLEDGENLSASEINILVNAGLATKDGKVTSKARKIYPELFEGKKYKDHWSVRCNKCGHPLNGRPKTIDGGYSQKCNACDATTEYELNESLNEDSSLAKIYDEGKAFAKKWMTDNEKNITFGKYDGDIKVPKGTKTVGDHNPYDRGTKESRAWKEGTEDAMYPSASRSKNPYGE